MLDDTGLSYFVLQLSYSTLGMKSEANLNLVQHRPQFGFQGQGRNIPSSYSRLVLPLCGISATDSP